MKRLWLIARIAGTAAVLGIVLYRIDARESASALLAASPTWVAMAFAFNVLAVLGSALLWREMTPADGRPSYIILTRRYFIGLFYNNAGPGTAVGDGVRVAGVWREGMRASRAAVSVLAERIISMLALLALATVGALYLLPGHGTVALGVWATVAACAAALVTALAGGRALIARMPMPAAARRAAESLVEAANALASQPRTIARGLAVALAVQLGTVAATYCVLRAVGAGISPAAALALTPVVALFVLLPVTVQGVGVREASYAYFFGFAGVASHDAVAAAFVSFLTTLACSAVGALLLLQPAVAGARRRLTHRAPAAAASHDAAPESRAA